MRKGITPIIAIIILLLITIALAGTAWVYLTGYVNVFITSSFDVLPGSFCRQNQATILVRNVGTSPISTVSNRLDQVDPYAVDGNTVVLYHMNSLIDKNDGSGDYIMLDESGGNNNGTVPGISVTTPPSIVSGKFGNALNFDGGEDFLDVPTAGIPQGNNPITYEAWVNITTYKITAGWGKGIAIAGFDAGDPTALTIENDTLMFLITNSSGSATVYKYSTKLKGNKSYHVAASYNNGTLRLSVDGNVQTNITTIPRVSATLFGVGAMYIVGSPNFFFKGRIDEVRISNVSRDFTQPQQGWNYVCQDTGSSTYACGDFTVVRTSGTGTFEPRFQTNAIEPKNVSRLIDPSCSGKCSYRLITASGGADVNLVC